MGRQSGLELGSVLEQLDVPQPADHLAPKRFVYILRRVTDPSRPYVGLTHDLPSRLADHNAGRCPHTARYRPWQLHVVIEFSDEQTAVRFERCASAVVPC
jgi:putative endonuclease